MELEVDAYLKLCSPFMIICHIQSKLMVISPHRSRPPKIYIKDYYGFKCGDFNIENASQYKYLGMWMNENLGHHRYAICTAKKY